MGTSISLGAFFANHTYAMVFWGTTIIGAVAGMLGTFAYLRKQSLTSDVISHSALPGTLLAFLLCVGLGVDGRNMVALLVGAVVTGTCAVMVANTITARTRTSIDAAMAISLSFFFGFGMLLLDVITSNPFPGKGGIQDYLFGNASVITRADLRISIIVGLLAVCVMCVLFKEFELRSFNPVQSTMLGFRPRVIDTVMFMTIALATVIGVKSVGLVLMVAFVVTPPAAARQWVQTVPAMVVLAGVFGAVGSGAGSYLSIALGNVPTGPVIVLVLFAVFLVSFIFAPKRSVIARARSQRRATAALRARLETTVSAEVAS